MEQLVGADTVSWELHPQQHDSATADTVTIDLNIPTLTPKQMSDIEAQCNAHIRAAHSIRQLVLDGSSKGQAERQKVIEKGNLRGKLPPADVIQVLLLTPKQMSFALFCSDMNQSLPRQCLPLFVLISDMIAADNAKRCRSYLPVMHSRNTQLFTVGVQNLLRLIEIDGVDINPCGGTHLTCTSQLQVLKIVGLEKSRGLARLRFMAGGRVINALGTSLKREAALNKVSHSSSRLSPVA